MSGLETAIRNALDRSDRADGKTRARIYQSARQALEAGLQKQGVSDTLIILQQRKRLEEKIREIETEEIDRLTAQVASAGSYDDDLSDDDHAVAAVPEFEPVVEPDRRMASVEAPVVAASPRGRSEEPDLGGATRQAPTFAGSNANANAGDLGGLENERLGQMSEAPAAQPSRLSRADRKKAEKAGKADKKARGRRGRADLNVAPERAAKPRKRRGFLSHLITWVVTLIIVAGGCWWFYSSGMVQSVIQDAVDAANQMARSQSGQPNSRFDPRGGFSDEWAEIFKPADIGGLKPGRQARVDAVDGSEGPAVRMLSATPTADGDIAITVPADLLKEMAAKTSTVAITVQAGANQGIQFSVSCDFGSLGTCARHRFTASQEKLEALFKVTFDRTLAPNAPGRLLINAGIDGADKPVLLYSVRILPGG